MGITNWQLFQKILSAWLLSLAFVVYSFYLIRNRKVYAFRKIIWSIACFWLIIDGFMDLLFSTTNLLVNYPFPIIAGASLFFFTLGIILSGFIYMIYLYDLFSVESYVYLQDKRQTYFAEKTANLAKSICGYNVHFLIAAFWALWYFYPQFVYMRMQ